jgi:hypothetical protein
MCALLRCYARSSGNPLPTFRDNVSFHLQGSRSTVKASLDILNPGDGTDMFTTEEPTSHQHRAET